MTVRRKSGISLAEVMISTAIMAVAVLALLGMFPAMLSSERSTTLFTVALYHAQEKLDAMLNANSQVSGITTDNPPDLPTGQRWWGQASGAQDSSSNQNGLCEIVFVEVRWVEPGGLQAHGRIRTIVLESEVAPSSGQ